MAAHHAAFVYLRARDCESRAIRQISRCGASGASSQAARVTTIRARYPRLARIRNSRSVETPLALRLRIPVMRVRDVRASFATCSCVSPRCLTTAAIFSTSGERTSNSIASSGSSDSARARSRALRVTTRLPFFIEQVLQSVPCQPQLPQRNPPRALGKCAENHNTHARPQAINHRSWVVSPCNLSSCTPCATLGNGFESGIASVRPSCKSQIAAPIALRTARGKPRISARARA